MKKIQIVYIGLILLGIMTAIGSYYLLLSNTNEVYIESYDRSKEFHLVEYATVKLQINIDEDYNETFIEVNDSKDFIKEIKENQSFKYMYTYTHGNGNPRDVYVFIENGYGYILYQDDSSKFVLRPAVALVVKDDIALNMQYIVNDYIEDLSYISFEDIDSNTFSSFDDFASYYTFLSQEGISIDYENDTIRLKGYDTNPQDDSKEYMIDLIFDDSGFTVSLVEVE